MLWDVTLCHRVRMSWDVALCHRFRMLWDVTLGHKIRMLWDVTLCHKFRVLLDMALCHRVRIFWKVTLCCSVRVFQHSKESNAFMFRVEAVHDESLIFILLLCMKLLFANYGIEYLYDFKENFFLIYMSDIYVQASMI